MVKAVAEATQTDLAMAGTSALSALSACTGGHARIEIRQGWQEPLNIYTATIADRGERKSSVQLSMVRPIHDVEKQLAEKGVGERLEAETRKQAAVKAAERARNAAATADKGKQDEAMSNAIGAAMIADSIKVPPIPRIVADDATPEAATSLLAEQGGRLAIISAEAAYSTSSPAATPVPSPTWIYGLKVMPVTLCGLTARDGSRSSLRVPH